MQRKLIGGHYQLIKVVGYNGSRQTYLVADVEKSGHPQYIAKRLPLTSKNAKNLKSIVNLLHKKVTILEKIGQHGQIAQTVAAFEEGNDFYLVRDFIPGQSLAAEIEYAQKLPEASVIAILKEILAILAFLRQHCVIHRSLNPANIIRRHPDRKLVLTDLGILEEARNQIFNSQKQLENLQADESFAYLPPEQYQYQLSSSSDIYGLGMVAIQALTGLSASNIVKLQAESNSQSNSFLWQTQFAVNPHLAAIINKMVHLNNRQRYQKVVEVIADLQALNTHKVSLSASNQQRKSSRAKLFSFKFTGAYFAPLCALSLLALPAIFFIPQIFSNRLESSMTASQEQTKKERQAIAEYTKVIKREPANGSAYYQRGLVYYRLQEDTLALTDFTEAIKHNFQNGDIYYKRGNVRFSLGDRMGALADFTQAIELDQQLVDAYVNRGFVQADLGKEQEAIADYTQAIALNPQDHDIYLNRCLAFSNQGQQTEALADCTQAINLQPDSAFAYQNRGLIRRRQEDFQGAIEDYNTAINLNPQDADPYYNRGLARRDLGDIPGAIADYTAAIERNPKHALAYYHRGLVQAEQGKQMEAKADFQETVKLCLDMGRLGCYEDAKYQLSQLD